ncbi:MAG: T9SS type A sorting domain-containing protein, partial [Candidatus Kapabacteria bacterium]|nr:T9SS type A sorting domain-containing protein [Candidatus Kapabacteria bacterium]
SDTLRSTAFGGITVFQWFRNGSEVPGATSRDLFTRTSGQYSVRAENASQCRSTSNEFTFVYNPTSVEEDISAGRVIGIYPNPTSDLAVISMPSAKGRTLEVIGVTGQVVFSTTVGDEASDYQLHLSGYATGVYVVRIKSAASVWMARLVRE